MSNSLDKHMEEAHRSHRSGWLRAAVLGANDGIVSTASLLLGVAAAGADRDAILVAGTAGLIAGAMSMAAGEYVSVSSQADTETADLARERESLEQNPDEEVAELAQIYVNRGLEPALADKVAHQLTAHDSLAAHARDELGLSDIHAARPLQAAFASALTFALGAALPLAIAAFSPLAWMGTGVATGSIVTLMVLGGLAAQAGGAPITRGAWRVGLWGVLAMAATAAVGALFGTVV